LEGQSECTAQVPVRNRSGGVRDVPGDGGARKESARSPKKQLVPIRPEELESDIVHGDDQVEPVSRVFQPEEIAKPRLVKYVRKSRPVDILRVVVQPLPETAI